MMWTDKNTDAVQSPVAEVLRAASLELRELHDRQLQLTKRIRTLRSAMAALHNLQRASAHSTQASSPCSETILPAPASRTENCGEADLRRACRIALLESCDALSDDEVLARIVRRGSYFFADYAAAIEAVTRELAAMSKDGEVEIDPSVSKWKRVVSAGDPSI